jgi:tetratricopeptide (TPR) repeat protein
VRGRGFQNAIDDRCERFDAQYHPWAAAEGPLVGARTRLAGRHDVVNAQLDELAFDGAAYDREARDRGEHFGKERDDIDVQHAKVSFLGRLFGSPPRAAAAGPFAAGVAALERGRLDDALVHFDVALNAARSARELALVHNKRALTQLRRGDRPAAVAALGDALAADALCVPAIVNVGNLLLEEGVLDDAVAHYEAALRIDDAYSVAHLNLGIAFKRLGRRGDAVRAFRRAHRLAARRRS